MWAGVLCIGKVGYLDGVPIRLMLTAEHLDGAVGHPGYKMCLIGVLSLINRNGFFSFLAQQPPPTRMPLMRKTYRLQEPNIQAQMLGSAPKESPVSVADPSQQNDLPMQLMH